MGYRWAIVRESEFLPSFRGWEARPAGLLSPKGWHPGCRAPAVSPAPFGSFSALQTDFGEVAFIYN